MEEKEKYIASEPVVARPLTSYADVMYYLHTIDISHEDKEKVAQRLTLEVNGKNLSRAFSQLDHLATLQQNWDGRGALHISRKVINNVKHVLAISDDEDWEDWIVSPGTNSTLYLVSKSHRASVSVGVEEYSYYGRIDGKDVGENHVVYNPAGLLDVMHKLNDNG